MKGEGEGEGDWGGGGGERESWALGKQACGWVGDTPNSSINSLNNWVNDRRGEEREKKKTQAKVFKIYQKRRKSLPLSFSLCHFIAYLNLCYCSAFCCSPFFNPDSLIGKAKRGGRLHQTPPPCLLNCGVGGGASALLSLSTNWNPLSLSLSVSQKNRGLFFSSLAFFFVLFRMPRPGPRPYECVRRAWHSDRHQPIRGSLIQEIFRFFLFFFLSLSLSLESPEVFSVGIHGCQGWRNEYLRWVSLSPPYVVLVLCG